MLHQNISKIYQEWIDLQIKYKDVLEGYSLKFNNRKTQLGLCDYVEKTIYLSNLHVEATSLEQMIDTLRHEVAHAYVYHHYKRRGHNDLFYHACRIIGAKPERCASIAEDVKEIKPKYIGVCKTHGIVGKYHKMIKRPYSCGKCSNKFDRRFLIEIKKYGEQ